MQHEVSMTTYMGRIANQRKVSKWLPFKNYMVKITKYLMCIYWGHTGIFVPKIKFLCLTLWLGRVCTDDANADDTRRR